MKYLNIGLSTFLLIFMISCDEKSHSDGTGTIVGFIELIDKNGSPIEDKEGVLVELENTSISATTNQIGKFEMREVFIGTYDIIYSKENFGSVNIQSFQFVGGGVPDVATKKYLYEMPSADLLNFQFEKYENLVIIEGEISDPKNVGLTVFLSTDATISDKNFEESYLIGLCCDYDPNFSYTLDLNNISLNNNQDLYMVLYASNVHENASFDIENDIIYYPTSKKVSDVVKID